MALTLVIPTRGRVGRQTTLNTLPREARSAVVLVASDEAEAEALRKTENLRKSQVIAAPSGAAASIAAKRQFILERFRGDILMLDDDMAPFFRCPLAARSYANGRWKPKTPGVEGLSRKYATDDKVLRVFEDLERELQFNVVHAGISSRLGNDTEANETRTAPQRMMHAIAYATAFLRKAKIRFDAVPVREDFHVTLELLKRGEPSYVVYNMCYSPGAYGAAGGCSQERTVAMSDAGALELARLHAPFVKVVDKVYKETPRKEVIVSWKKCYESARKT